MGSSNGMPWSVVRTCTSADGALPMIMMAISTNTDRNFLHSGAAL
jgi:hypothetical protein